MMGRLRERIRTALRAFEEGGLKWVVLTIWRYLLFWSPMAPLLEQKISETHREKLSNFRNIGYWPQIRDPRSFNEKVIHRKLFTDDDRYTTVEDKWAVREYIRDRAEMEVLPDIYHVTDDPNTIPFEALPDEFVVKGTHGSDMNYFVEDTSDLDVKEIKSQCNEWLDQTYGECTNEYWYRDPAAYPRRGISPQRRVRHAGRVQIPGVSRVCQICRSSRHSIRRYDQSHLRP